MFFRMIISVFLVASMAGCGTESTSSAVALVGGQLVSGLNEPAIRDSVVVYDGNRIIAAGARDSVEIPAGATVMDITGKTVMPGLVDMHIHLDLIGHGEYEDYYIWMDNMRRLPEVFPIAAVGLMRAGVTTAVDLGSTFHIKAARERIRNGEIAGPRLIISGPWITRIHMDGIPDGYQLVITSPEEAREAVRWLVSEGSDVIKTWEGLTLEDRIAINDEAHRAGLKVHAHLYEPQDIRDAITAGVDVLQHVGSAMNAPYDSDIVDQIVNERIPVVQTISHRIWIWPETVANPGRLSVDSLRADMGAEIFAEVQGSFRDIGTLSYFRHIDEEIAASELAAPQFIDAGAYMAVGTDAASPMNFHHEAMPIEMLALVESGMTTAEVLQAATRVGAEILELDDETGTIEPGKVADIIIVDGDPLADIRAMHKVVVTIRDGVAWYDPAVDSTFSSLSGRAYPKN
jgi:imidazolonepropionase-like amidohydrolase